MQVAQNRHVAFDRGQKADAGQMPGNCPVQILFYFGEKGITAKTLSRRRRLILRNRRNRLVRVGSGGVLRPLLATFAAGFRRLLLRRRKPCRRRQGTPDGTGENECDQQGYENAVKHDSDSLPFRYITRALCSYLKVYGRGAKIATRNPVTCVQCEQI